MEQFKKYLLSKLDEFFKKLNYALDIHYDVWLYEDVNKYFIVQKGIFDCGRWNLQLTWEPLVETDIKTLTQHKPLFDTIPEALAWIRKNRYFVEIPMICEHCGSKLKKKHLVQIS